MRDYFSAAPKKKAQVEDSAVEVTVTRRDDRGEFSEIVESMFDDEKENATTDLKGKGNLYPKASIKNIAAFNVVKDTVIDMEVDETIE